MDELRLDGNAAAGTLGQVFSFEVTTAEYACGGCGRTGMLGGAMVYEVRELGTIVRCPSCDTRPYPACSQPGTVPRRSQGDEIPRGRTVLELVW
jgi:DNA-directed RNA polymerase subunit RPC12/RpoP